MKKIISIALVSLYMILSVGIAKSTHFCMGEPLDTTYFTLKTSGCNDDIEEVPMECCDDQLEVVILEDDQNRGVFDFSTEALYLISPFNQPLEFHSLLVAQDENAFKVFPRIKPPPRKQPLYQLNCSFTFYG